MEGEKIISQFKFLETHLIFTALFVILFIFF